MTAYLLTILLTVVAPMLGIWPLKFSQERSGTNNAFFIWLASKEWFESRSLSRQATAAHEFFENWFPWAIGAIVSAPVAYFYSGWAALGLMTLVMFIIRTRGDAFDLMGHSAECYWEGDPDYTLEEAHRRGVDPKELTKRFWFTRLVVLLSLRIKKF